MFSHLEDHVDVRNGAISEDATQWIAEPPGPPGKFEYLPYKPGATARHRAMSLAPVQSNERPSARAISRPRLAQSSRSADNKRRQSTLLERPPMANKKFKSDSAVGQQSKEKDNRGTRPRKGEATVTYICVSSSPTSYIHRPSTDH